LIKNDPQIIGIDIFTIFRKLNNSNLFLYDENETIKLKLNIKLSLVIKLFFHTLTYLNSQLEAILNVFFGKIKSTFCNKFFFFNLVVI